MSNIKSNICIINLRGAFIMLLIIGLNYLLTAQETGFEIIMDADYDELPIVFKRSDNDCFIGLVKKAIFGDSTGTYNTFLYKIDPNGDTTSTMFNKEDTVSNFYYLDRLTTEPKGYLLTGWGYEIGGSSSNRFTIIRRIDDDFGLVWENIFKFDYYYSSPRASTLELTNGDIVYACSPNLNLYMFIMRMSPLGDSLDFKSYSGDDSGEVWGMTYNYDSTSIWLNTKWAHYPGGGYVSSVITLNDSLEQVDVDYLPEHFHPPYNSLWYNEDLLLLGGRDQFYGQNFYEFMVGAYLLDTAFNVVYEVHLTDPDTVSRGGETQAVDFYYSKCIYLGGTHNLQGLFGSQPSWYYITKLNDTLGVEYEKYIGGDNYYWLMSVTASSDGGVLLAGNYQEIGQTTLNRDVLILKLDSTGCTTNNLENSIEITEAIIYPNPGSDYINIRTALKGCLFSLFDNLGRKVLSLPISEKITTVKVKELISGNYNYSITKKNKKVISGIWIKY